MNLFNSRSEEQFFAYKTQKVKAIYFPLFNINMFPMDFFSINNGISTHFRLYKNLAVCVKRKMKRV